MKCIVDGKEITRIVQDNIELFPVIDNESPLTSEATDSYWINLNGDLNSSGNPGVNIKTADKSRDLVNKVFTTDGEVYSYRGIVFVRSGTTITTTAIGERVLHFEVTNTTGTYNIIAKNCKCSVQAWFATVHADLTDVTGVANSNGNFIRTLGASAKKGVITANLRGNSRVSDISVPVRNEVAGELTLNMYDNSIITNGGSAGNGNDAVNTGLVLTSSSGPTNVTMYNSSIIGNGSASGRICGCVVNINTGTLNLTLNDDAEVIARINQNGSSVATVSNTATNGRFNVVLNGNSKLEVDPQNCNTMVNAYNNGQMTITCNDNSSLVCSTGARSYSANIRNEDNITLTMNGSSSLVHPVAVDSMSSSNSNILTTYLNNIRENRTVPSKICVATVSGYSAYVIVNYGGSTGNASQYLKRV